MSPAAARLPKCQPTPPPSPKILHFPLSRRTRRRKNITHHSANSSVHTQQNYLSGKFENLFDRENDYEYPTVHVSPLVLLPPNLVFSRRERVEVQGGGKEEDDHGGGGGGLEEEKWEFQAEMLRAECNLLRMEREFAFKKLEEDRVKMETTLRSAVESLVSGRRKISDGEGVKAVLEEEIQDLAEKLEELQNSSRHKTYPLPNCSNFDTKANLLRRHLEELRELTEDKDSSSKPENKSKDVELQRRKMGVHSSSVLTSTAKSSASTSRRIADEFPEIKCSGRCKTVVRRVVEQVRAETEQWSQMQEMLRQVRGQMEELQASRDFWENRAHSSDCEVRSLRHTVEEWKEKALAYENNVNELQLQLYAVQWDIRKSGTDLKANQDVPTLPLGKQLENEKHALSHRRKKKKNHVNGKSEFNNALEEHKERTLDKDLAPLSLGKQLAKEKKMLLHKLKENQHARRKGNRELMSTDAESKRYSSRLTGEHSTLQDIGNSPCLARQSSRAASGRHSPPETFKTRERFRK